LCEKIEAEKQELEGKVIVAQHEVQDLQHHIRVIKVQIQKTLQVKKK
jgi:hypothetical protein